MSFLKRLCCCCCCCCEDGTKEKPLLNGTSPQETTPTPEQAGISEVRVRSDHDGDEIQEVEVKVQDEGRGQETPVVLRLKKDAELTPGDGPSERARVDSGTFVRNSSSRLSWRLVPTVTQQAREAAMAKDKAELEEQRRSVILTSSSNLGDGSIVFPDETIEEDERQVTLVSEEVGGPDKVGVASVTVLVAQGEISDTPEQVSYIEGEGSPEPRLTEGARLDPVEYGNDSPVEVKGEVKSSNHDPE